MFLFTPEPQQPQNYAERCLDHALGIYHPGVTWEGLREGGASDDELQIVVSYYVFGLNKAWRNLGRGADFMGWDAWGGDNPRFWAERECEANCLRRSPDFQGTALLEAVRKLRGIWRPQ